MYNGIGLQTARGSGTNGHVQRNWAFVRAGKKDNIAYKTEEDISKLDAAMNRQPNQGILDHERKRKIEVKCAEFEEILEKQGYTVLEIKTKIDSYRTKLLDQGKADLPKDEFGRIAVRETHQVAEAQQQKNAKLREAFGISEYFVEGSSFDSDRQAKEELAKSQAVQDEIERQKEAEKEKSRQYALLRTPSKEKEISSIRKSKSDSVEKKKKKRKHRDGSASPARKKDKKTKKSKKHKKERKKKKSKKRRHSDANLSESEVEPDDVEREKEARKRKKSKKDKKKKDKQKKKKHQTDSDKSRHNSPDLKRHQSPSSRREKLQPEKKQTTQKNDRSDISERGRSRDRKDTVNKKPDSKAQQMSRFKGLSSRKDPWSRDDRRRQNKRSLSRSLSRGHIRKSQSPHVQEKTRSRTHSPPQRRRVRSPLRKAPARSHSHSDHRKTRSPSPKRSRRERSASRKRGASKSSKVLRSPSVKRNQKAQKKDLNSDGRKDYRSKSRDKPPERKRKMTPERRRPSRSSTPARRMIERSGRKSRSPKAKDRSMSGSPPSNRMRTTMQRKREISDNTAKRERKYTQRSKSRSPLKLPEKPIPTKPDHSKSRSPVKIFEKSKYRWTRTQNTETVKPISKVESGKRIEPESQSVAPEILISSSVSSNARLRSPSKKHDAGHKKNARSSKSKSRSASATSKNQNKSKSRSRSPLRKEESSHSLKHKRSNRKSKSPTTVRKENNKAVSSNISRTESEDLSNRSHRDKDLVIKRDDNLSSERNAKPTASPPRQDIASARSTHFAIEEKPVAKSLTSDTESSGQPLQKVTSVRRNRWDSQTRVSPRPKTDTQSKSEIFILPQVEPEKKSPETVETSNSPVEEPKCASLTSNSVPSKIKELENLQKSERKLSPSPESSKVHRSSSSSSQVSSDLSYSPARRNPERYRDILDEIEKNKKIKQQQKKSSKSKKKSPTPPQPPVRHSSKHTKRVQSSSQQPVVRLHESDDSDADDGNNKARKSNDDKYVDAIGHDRSEEDNLKDLEVLKALKSDLAAKAKEKIKTIEKMASEVSPRQEIIRQNSLNTFIASATAAATINNNNINITDTDHGLTLVINTNGQSDESPKSKAKGFRKQTSSRFSHNSSTQKSSDRSEGHNISAKPSTDIVVYPQKPKIIIKPFKINTEPVQTTSTTEISTTLTDTTCVQVTSYAVEQQTDLHARSEPGSSGKACRSRSRSSYSSSSSGSSRSSQSRSRSSGGSSRSSGTSRSGSSSSASSKQTRIRSRSPSIPRRRGSPSFLDRRRITSARKRPIPYYRPTPSSVSVSTASSYSSRSCSRSRSRTRSPAEHIF